jgi:hypothetical protein
LFGRADHAARTDPGYLAAEHIRAVLGVFARMVGLVLGPRAEFMPSTHMT